MPEPNNVGRRCPVCRVWEIRRRLAKKYTSRTKRLSDILRPAALISKLHSMSLLSVLDCWLVTLSFLPSPTSSRLRIAGVASDSNMLPRRCLRLEIDVLITSLTSVAQWRTTIASSRARLTTLDRAIAEDHICPSVRLSVCHTGDPHQNGLTYRNIFYTTR